MIYKKGRYYMVNSSGKGTSFGSRAGPSMQKRRGPSKENSGLNSLAGIGGSLRPSLA